MIQGLLERLARFLDRPLFPWRRLIIGFSLGQFCLENWLLWRQYGVYQRTVRPKALEQEISQETYDKSQAYGRDKAKFAFLASLYNEAKSLAILYYDIWPKVWALTGIWLARYLPARFSGEITHSLLFVFLFSFVDTIVDLPLSYYHHFVLEEKFGFNKMSIKLWLMDKIKTQALTIALGTPIGGAALWIIQKTGNSFFYYMWIFTLLVSIFFVTIYPIWIVPIFNKLTPLQPGPLKEAVESLAKKLKFPLAELQVIDGSKRSSHSNAYFTGLPWKKKIVIFDTLLEQSTNKEVEAVLAHELGHWNMSHTTKLLAINQANVFYLFALFSAFIDNRSLYEAFGFFNERPIIIGFMLFNEVQSPMESVIKLIMNIITRSFEYQADNFALRLGYGEELAAALIKLQVKNLSAMDADYLYSSYHYSHPILTERLKAIGWKGDKKVEPKAQDGSVSGSQDSEKPLKAADREL